MSTAVVSETVMVDLPLMARCAYQCACLLPIDLSLTEPWHRRQDLRPSCYCCDSWFYGRGSDWCDAVQTTWL